VVELFLDRLAPGRSEIELDDELVREDQVLHGRAVAGFRARVSGALIVDAMDQKILVHGTFDVEREMVCDRCGEPFDMAFPAAVEVMILRSPGRGGEEDSDEDGWVIHQSGGIVHLDDALLEAVALDTPQRAANPQHEHDEDVGDQAGEDKIDPRWEALRQLRGEKGESEGPSEAN
jgi:uncharacterized metal-binding protein YceD (DUF177 family)